MNIIFIKFLAIIANFLDYFTTVIAIKKYRCKEVNPIARWLLKRPILMFLVKIIWVSYLIIISPKITSIIVCILFGLCAINNFINILISRRRMKKEKQKEVK